MTKENVIQIVDACFHMFASSYRIEAMKEADKMYDRRVTSNNNCIEALKNLRIRMNQRRNIERNPNEDTMAFDVFINDVKNIINELSGI